MLLKSVCISFFAPFVFHHMFLSLFRSVFLIAFPSPCRRLRCCARFGRIRNWRRLGGQQSARIGARPGPRVIGGVARACVRARVGRGGNRESPGKPRATSYGKRRGPCARERATTVRGGLMARIRPPFGPHRHLATRFHAGPNRATYGQLSRAVYRRGSANQWDPIGPRPASLCSRRWGREGWPGGRAGGAGGGGFLLRAPPSGRARGRFASDR